MMRIGIVTPFVSGFGGGISRYTQDLAVEFRTGFGLECLEIAPRQSHVSLSRRPLSTVATLFRTFLRLSIERPRAVFVQANPAMLVPALVYAKLTPNCPVIYTFHTAPDKGEISDLKRLAILWLISRCKAVVFSSRYLLDTMKSVMRLPDSLAVRVVVPGVRIHPSTWAEKQTARDASAGRWPVLSYVGAMTWPGKVAGLRILISTLPKLRKRWPTVRLLVAGSGPLARSVEQLCDEQGVRDLVVFLGQVSSPEACYSVSTCYVHISLHESLGLSILEAMACGVPVIASDSGGIREVVQDGVTGTVVQASPSNVSEAIVHLLENPVRTKALAQSGQREVHAHFTWHRAAQELLDLADIKLSRGSA